MIGEIVDLLRFGFVQRALLAGTLIAMGCGILGVFPVLRRMAMIGDGLSHFAFGAVGLALLLDRSPLWVALPCVTLASLLILKLPERAALYGDAAIGMVSAVGIALGVLLASIGEGFNIDLFAFLFGDILAIRPSEVGLAALIVLGLSIVVTLFYHELFVVTFDAATARVLGIHIPPINRVLAVLTGLLVVLGIRLVGTLLVSSLLIFPAVTALQCSRGFKTTLLLAAGIGALSVLGGMFLALGLDLPAGATIVAVNALFFAASLATGRRTANGVA